MTEIAKAIEQIPNYLGHEHWGSLAAFGTDPGFRPDWFQGALPRRPVSFADILLDPYFRMWADPGGKMIDALFDGNLYQEALESPAAVLTTLDPLLQPQRLTGVYQCIRLGLITAHGLDLEEKDPNVLKSAQEKLTEAYGRYFSWLPEMMERGRFSALVRPVEPEFYFQKDSEVSAPMEGQFLRTLLRIDGLIQMGKASDARRKNLAGLLQVDPPVDADSWGKFLDALFSRARQKGARGIKQLQAYRRSLDFSLPPDFHPLFSGPQKSEDFLLENWALHRCCQRAHDLNWPHQVHTGTHNLPASNPLPLQQIAQAYPCQSLVLLHCWPFLDESAFLAKSYGNVYLDPCWLAVLSPAFLRRALKNWLQFVPVSRILLSHDATSLEMALGSAILNRQILAETLSQDIEEGIPQETRLNAAHALLHENGERLYGQAG